MNKKIFVLSFLYLGNFFSSNASYLENRKYAGVFTRSDKTLPGLKWGNWGSRPYEYAWAAKIVSITGKRVIDLGVGLPSQYDWYLYAVNNLKPSFYAGVDHDGRMQAEVITASNYEMRYMSMAELEYPDKSFDIAYCISTFEHIPYDIFVKTIQEAHRVLTDDGLLVITLDEEWDKNVAMTHGNGWNLLEQSLIERNLFKRQKRSFGLPEFLDLIKDYFVLYQDDMVVDNENNTVRSINNIYYNRRDRDPMILNSGIDVNSCVSYALLKKKV